MPTYTKFITKDAIHKNSFSKERLSKYDIQFKCSYETDAGFPEIYHAASKDHALEIVIFGHHISGFRTKSGRGDAAIQRLINIIEIEFSTIIYDQGSYQYYGFENQYQQHEYEQLDQEFNFQSRGYSYDGGIIHEIKEKFKTIHSLEVPDLDDQYHSKIYFGCKIVYDFPKLLEEQKEDEILIRASALYRDERLKTDIFQSLKKILPIIDQINEGPRKESRLSGDVPF